MAMNFATTTELNTGALECDQKREKSTPVAAAPWSPAAAAAAAADLATTTILLSVLLGQPSEVDRH